MTSIDVRPLALPPLARGPHVFLSGPMGAGKSTLARGLGEALGRPVIDLDRRIEEHTQRTVAELFRERGETAFRDLEAELALAIAASSTPSVVALGGGTVVRDATRAALIARGAIVTLEASLDVLAQRVAHDGERPLLRGGDPRTTLASLLAARASAYAEAHVVSSAEGDPAALVSELTRALASHPVLVPFGLRSYRATFGPRDAAAALLPADVDAVLVVCDPNTRVHAAAVEAAIEASGRRARSVELGAGEHFKNVGSLEVLWDAAADFELSRDGAFVAVGGGVLGDVTGLAAATWLRGVAFGVVPTTLLSMADSAIGGKTAIDRRSGKNLVGAFHQPRFVRIDVETLETLPERERRAGLAEVAKCAWLAGEEALDALFCDAEALARGDREATLRAVELAARVKARIVAADETESGARRALNLGHTLGHAFESASAFSLLHGEAVALGLLAAVRVGVSLGALSPEWPSRLLSVLEALGLPTEVDAWLARGDLVPHLRADKKRSGERVRFVVPGPPGEVGIAQLTTEEILAAARR